jgi:hypothetical protein
MQNTLEGGIINDKKVKKRPTGKKKRTYDTNEKHRQPEDGITDDYLHNYNRVPFYYTRKRIHKKKGEEDNIVEAEKGGRLA